MAQTRKLCLSIIIALILTFNQLTDHVVLTATLPATISDLWHNSSVPYERSSSPTDNETTTSYNYQTSNVTINSTSTGIVAIQQPVNADILSNFKNIRTDDNVHHPSKSKVLREVLLFIIIPMSVLILIVIVYWSVLYCVNVTKNKRIDQLSEDSETVPIVPNEIVPIINDCPSSSTTTVSVHHYGSHDFAVLSPTSPKDSKVDNTTKCTLITNSKDEHEVVHHDAVVQSQSPHESYQATESVLPNKND